MTPATGAAAASALGGGLADDSDGKFHILQGDVLADGGDEMLGHRVGGDGTVELEADGFSSEVWEGVCHFAVECEAEVGVHFLLKLEETLLGAVPRARLDHDENGFAGLAIECEGIETTRVFDAKGG